MTGVQTCALPISFQNIFSGFPPASQIGQDFKRIATSYGLTVNDDAPSSASSQVVLRVLEEQRQKLVVGSSIAGQVREFQLRIRLRFALFTPQGRTLIDESEIAQQRDFSYTESQALAKEAEELLIYRDMQSEIVQQLLRRLAAVKSLS